MNLPMISVLSDVLILHMIYAFDIRTGHIEWLGFFELEFSLSKASVHNGLVCLVIILVCMLQIVCSVL